MGRRKAKGQRTKSGALSRALSAILDRNPPADHILKRREQFSFVEATKGGNIDQDVCDAIGQLHALGKLDMPGVDALAMRNAGRDYAELYWNRYSDTAPKVGKYERADKSMSPFDGETSRDRRFARMDAALVGLHRTAVFELVIDYEWCIAPAQWADSIINLALYERGKRVEFMIVPTWEDEAMLQAAREGLCLLAVGVLPIKRELAA